MLNEKRMLILNIDYIMRQTISSDYINDILSHTTKNGNTILDCIVDDVLTSSAFYECDYNDDDIRLAIGRTFIKVLEE